MGGLSPLFERVKPSLDVVSQGTVKLTAQSQSGKGSQVAVAIDQKLGVRETMVLGKSMEECCGRISPMMAEQLDVQQEFRLDINCSVDPVPLATDLDSSFHQQQPAMAVLSVECRCRPTDDSTARQRRATDRHPASLRQSPSP